jgi:thiol-disulfide isomerase/thioredoxin
MSRPARLAGFALLAALAVLLVVRLVWVGKNWDSLRPVGGAQAAPGFTLPLLQGGSFTLEGTGQVTLVDFFASWCGPCREELPHVDALYRRYKDRGVRVVAVDAEPPEAKEFTEKLARDLGLTLPIALGGDGVAEKYHVENLPTVLVVDGKGRIGRILLGSHSESEIEALIQSASP